MVCQPDVARNWKTQTCLCPSFFSLKGLPLTPYKYAQAYREREVPSRKLAPLETWATFRHRVYPNHRDWVPHRTEWKEEEEGWKEGVW